MILVLALVGFGIAVTLAAPLVLEFGRWRVRHPRLALRAWDGTLCVAIGSLLASVIVAASIVVAHAGAAGGGSGGAGSGAGAGAGAGAFGDLGAGAGAFGGAGFGATVAALFTWSSLAAAGAIAALLLVRAEPIGAAKQRSEAAIAILTARAAYRRQWIGTHEIVFFRAEAPIACSTGGGRILISSAIDEAMPPISTRAIIEHERAHIRLRHDLVIRLAALNEAAFPFLPTARAFRKTVALLIELVADDEAARLVGPAAVCNALAAMSTLDPDPGLALRAERIARTPVRSRTRLDRLEPAVQRPAGR